MVQPRPGGHGGANEDHLTNDLLGGMILQAVKACESCNSLNMARVDTESIYSGKEVILASLKLKIDFRLAEPISGSTEAMKFRSNL